MADNIRMKTCTKCGIEKPLDAYGRFSDSYRPRRKDRLRPQCLACEYARKKSWQEQVLSDPARRDNFIRKRRARGIKHLRKLSPEERRERAKRTQQKTHASGVKNFYAWHLSHKFGITPEEYLQLLSRQDGRCAICKKLPTEGRWKTLCVDHDHETGKVRALLCRGCNSALGWLNDDLDLILRCADYIREHKEVIHKVA